MPDRASAVAVPERDAILLHPEAGMTVIVEDGSDWRMAEVIRVDGDLVTHIVPRR
mgnify:CR=1 FL=1